MFEKNRNSEQQTLILKHLDILAYTDPRIFKEQEQPSAARAQIQLKPTLIRDEAGEPFRLTCSLQEFKKYGPGVYLVFKFMKFLLISMLFAIPFPIANIIILQTSGKPNQGSTLQDTTISEMAYGNPLIINFNLVILLILTVALIYWKQNEQRLVLECSKQICMPSYLTVILTDIPNHYTERQFKDYIEERYGRIVQISTAKNYHDGIKKYKKIYDLVEEFKEERQYYIRNKSSESCIKIVEKFIQFRKMHHQISDSNWNKNIYQPYCAFITFENSIQKWKLLEDQKKVQSFFRCIGSQYRNGGNEYKNQKVKFIHCEMEPDGVAWQNLNMSSRQAALRCAIITFLLLAFLFLSITVIFVLAAAESALYLDKYDQMTQAQAMSSNEIAALKSYCLDLSFAKFKQNSACRPFQSSFINYCILYYIFPIAITILKMIFGSIMKRMVSIRRHKNSFQKLQWQIIIISLFYFIKSALIKFVVYRNFTFGSVRIRFLEMFLPILLRLKAILPIEPQQIKTFNQFSSQWVRHASHKVILIAIISFNFTILYHFFFALITKKYHEFSARKMKTQRRVNAYLKGQQFEIEMVYAELIAIFLFCMVYFSCMPIIYVLIYFSLLLLYWVSKYSFIKFCRKPLVYAHGINTLSVKLIIYGIIMSCLVSPMYYEELGLAQAQQHSIFIELTRHWQYLSLALFIIIYMLWGKRLIKLILLAYNKFRKWMNSRFTGQHYINQLKEISGGKNNIQSYSMLESEKYRQILEVLFIMNEIQINRIGYFTNDKIQSLRQDVNKNSHQFKIFNEIIADLQAESNDAKNGKSSKQKQYLEMLKGIRDEVAKEIVEQQKQRQINQLVKSKISKLIPNKDVLFGKLKEENILKLKSQIKSQLSNDMNLDMGPQTDSRLH